MKLKYIFLLTIFFAAANFASAIDVVSPAGVELEDMAPTAPYQEVPTNKPDEQVPEVPDKMPEFPGGQKAMSEYMALHFNYPGKAKEDNIEGRVVVRFIVDKEGNVTNATVIKSVSEELDKEALRIVTNMPQWIPGEKEGKKISTYFVLPVLFKLQ